MIMEVFEILRPSVLAFLTLHISVHFSPSFFRHLHLLVLQPVLLSETVSSMVDSGTGNLVMTASCCCITVSHFQTCCSESGSWGDGIRAASITELRSVDAKSFHVMLQTWVT